MSENKKHDQHHTGSNSGSFNDELVENFHDDFLDDLLGDNIIDTDINPASPVIDRFHVAQHYRDDFDDLRKQELRSLKKGHSPQIMCSTIGVASNRKTRIARIFGS